MPRPRKDAVRIALVFPSLLGTYGDGGNASVLAQRLQQGQQRIGPRQRLGFRMARPDQPGELLGRHFQLIALDAEEVADALEVERRGTALPAQVLVELRPIDCQLAAHLGNRAVVTAEQLQVFGEVGGHGMP